MIKQKLLPIIYTKKLIPAMPINKEIRKIPIHHTMTLEEIIKNNNKNYIHRLFTRIISK
jgi:hypothetical protein